MFVVENGSGISNANAYLSVADFKSYHDDRGQDYSAYTDTTIEQALVRATDYLDRRYKSSWVGYRHHSQQALDWPRISAFYNDGRSAVNVPVEVAQATAEYALRALSGSLAPDPTYSETNAPILEKEEQVGPIRERTAYGGGGAFGIFRKYPLADALLRELTARGRELLRV